MERVVIVMGSSSDKEKMEPAFKVLHEFGIDVGVYCLSAHRAHDELIKLTKDIAKNADKTEVVIAGAGMAAALPGVIASQVTVPVIGVPLSSKTHPDGQDAIHSILNMPPGIPVATVGADAAKNAGLLAAQILGIKDPEVRDKLLKDREAQHAKNLRANEEVYAYFCNLADRSTSNVPNQGTSGIAPSQGTNNNANQDAGGIPGKLATASVPTC